MAKILVVEDESIVAMDIKNRLKRLGYDVPSIALAGEEAVEKAAKICPDLVLMDIKLKGEMDGIEAARQIHERLDIPIVYLTAFSDEDTLQRAKITGPFGYIIKPIEDRELHVALDIALYKHKMERNLKESEEELRKSRDDLEIRVQERTAELAAANKDLMEEIAEREKVERALHESESRLKKIFDTVQAGVVIIDPKTHIIVDINPVAASMIGMEKDQIIGTVCHEFICPAERGRCPITDLGQSADDSERLLINTDKMNLPIIKTAAPILLGDHEYLIESFIDISALKLAEAALHHKVEFENIITTLSTNFINLGMEKIDSGINYALKQVGRFSDIDRCYIFQFSDDMTKMDTTHEWCAEGIVPQIENLKDLSAEDFPWGVNKLQLFENIYIPRVADIPPEASAEKEILEAQSIQSLIVIPMVSDGRLIGYLGFDSVRSERAWSDEDIKLLKITGELLSNALRRKRVESEKARLIKELGAKNAEMERFTYTVSHDLRSPLITIQGFLGFLKMDMSRRDDKKSNTDIKMIEEAVKNMDALLASTLELSRIGRVVNPPRVVPYEEIVKYSLAQLAEKIRSNGISVLVAKDLPQVYVDRMRITEVLVNLIENSIKYMGNQKDPLVEIGYNADNEKPFFFVRDNGMGIDPSQHEKVFELFYKLDNKSEGSGAGMAIVKRILEVYGGLVWIESEKGNGCKICFTLPLVGNI
jgi:PAS domain S-box-containing protein